MPTDRTLAITATPRLTYPGPNQFGATMSYEQTGSDPNMPPVVDKKTGDITLKKMPSNNNYTDNVDITITLDTSQLVDQNGNPVQGRWAHENEYSGTGPVTGFCWFCATPTPGCQKDATPITVPGMATVRNSDTVVVIDDNTADGDTIYTFCLGLVLPEHGIYYITIDPKIVGKGIGAERVNEMRAIMPLE